VASPADGVTRRPEQQGDEAKHEDDDPDRPDDRDPGDKPNDQQDDSDGNHDLS
jgi:hypothetical protein